MLESQKLSLRASEVRSELNALVAKEELTDDERLTLGSKSKELEDVEVRWRAAVTVENSEKETLSNVAAGRQPEDSQQRELMELRNRVSLGGYVAAAAKGHKLDGEYVELNQALSAQTDDVHIPFALLVDEVEMRAAGTTTTSQISDKPNQSILQRLFAPQGSAAMAMGVRFESCPIGTKTYELVTNGTKGGVKAESATSQASERFTFATTTFTPRRLAARVRFSNEMTATVMGAEDALRQDLQSALRDLVENQIFQGNGTAPNISGLTHALTAPTAPSTTATLGTYLAAPASMVDGIHAVAQSQTDIVVSPSLYAEMGAVLGTGSDMTAIQLLSAITMLSASSHVPEGTAANRVAFGHAGRNFDSGVERADFVVPTWGDLLLIRDMYTRAAEGEVELHGSILFDGKVIRSAAYKRFAFQTS